jgi:hypothetical protein
MRWAGHVAHKGEMKNVYKIVGKPEGKRPLKRPRHKWKDNIKMDLKWGLGCELDSSGSGYGPVLGSCEHGNESSGSIKCGQFHD